MESRASLLFLELNFSYCFLDCLPEVVDVDGETTVSMTDVAISTSSPALHWIMCQASPAQRHGSRLGLFIDGRRIYLYLPPLNFVGLIPKRQYYWPTASLPLHRRAA